VPTPPPTSTSLMTPVSSFPSTTHAAQGALQVSALLAAHRIRLEDGSASESCSTADTEPHQLTSPTFSEEINSRQKASPTPANNNSNNNSSNNNNNTFNSAAAAAAAPVVITLDAALSRSLGAAPECNEPGLGQAFDPASLDLDFASLNFGGLAASTLTSPMGLSLPMPLTLPSPGAAGTTTMAAMGGASVPGFQEYATDFPEFADFPELAALTNLHLEPPAQRPSLPPSALPSVGSAGHETGRCKPCAFLYKDGCRNGPECPFCHLCPEEERKRRKQQRTAAAKQLREARAARARRPEPMPRHDLFSTVPPCSMNMGMGMP